MTDAVFKRKYTSTNSYKNRRRKLEDRNETEDAASAAPAPASPSTSKIRSKMQTRVGSMVSDGDLCENHTQNNTPIKQPNEQHTHDHNDDDITMPADVDGDTAQSDQPQASSTLSKRTYAKVRSYRNDAPSSNWIDEPVREGYSELRKKWGVDDSDEEEDHTATHKSFSQLRSAGVSRRYDEELSYICDGFVGESPSIRRSSALSVSQKLSNQNWKKWLLDSEECLDRVWSGITQHLGNGDAIFDAISSIIITHLSQTHTMSPLASLKPSFCSKINSLYHNNNSNDVFRMSEKFLSRSERPLLREVKAVAEGVVKGGEGQITVPRLLVHAVDEIGECNTLQDYADVVEVALDAFDRARVVVEEIPYIMRLMKVVERSADAASFAIFKKLATVFGWLADQDECSEEYLKSITKAMVTLSVERREAVKHVFVTGRVAGDTLTHLSQRHSEGHSEITTLLLGLLMNLIELGGEGVADIYKVISMDDTIAQIFNTNHSQLNNETDVREMSPKVVLCTLSSCILSNCMVATPGYAQKLRTRVNLTDTTNVLRLNLVLDDSEKASLLVEKVESIVNNL